MRNKKDVIELVLLGTITILLIIGLILTAIHFKKEETKTNGTDSNTLNQELNKEPEEQKQQESTKQESNTNNQNNTNTTPQDNSTNKENNASSSTSNNNQNSSSNTKEEQKPQKNEANQEEPQKEELAPSENEIVAYFENLNNEIQTTNENNPTFREKAKNAFTTVVDFLFYDSKIKGYTFKELTTSAKLKVINTALKIDNKIDEYFPNYKNSIKAGYENIKGKAALLYLETTSKLCESVGSTACEEARRNFKDMKESFGFTFSLIQSAAGSSYQYLKEILSEWYQSIK